MLPCTAQTEHTLSNNDIHRHTCGVTTYRLSPITYQVVKTLLKIFIQENAADLHSWVQPNDTRDDGQRKTQILSKYESLSLNNLLSTGHHSLGVLFITSQKSNLCTALTTQNSTGNGCYLTRTKHDCTLD